MRRKLFGVIFVIWVALWILFIARELIIKGAIKEYKVLLPMSLDEKHSYVTGARLYDFILFCNNVLPANASYKLVGVEGDSIDQRRAVYYLYPHMQHDRADYILVFGAPNAHEGYEVIAALDKDRYILKKVD